MERRNRKLISNYSELYYDDYVYKEPFTVIEEQPKETYTGVLDSDGNRIMKQKQRLGFI